MFQVMGPMLDQRMDKEQKEMVCTWMYEYIDTHMGIHKNVNTMYISGYGAHAGQANGKAAKGNGM